MRRRWSWARSQGHGRRRPRLRAAGRAASSRSSPATARCSGVARSVRRAGGVRRDHPVEPFQRRRRGCADADRVATSPATGRPWRTRPAPSPRTPSTASTPGSRFARAIAWALGSEAGNLPVAFTRLQPEHRIAQLVDHAIGDPQGAGMTKNGYRSSVVRARGDRRRRRRVRRRHAGPLPVAGGPPGACPSTPGAPGGGDTGKDTRASRRWPELEAVGAGLPGRELRQGVRRRRQDGAGRHAACRSPPSEAGSVKFRVAAAGAAGRKVGKKCKAPTRRTATKKRCTRYPALKGSFTVPATPGTNAFTFRGASGQEARARPLPPAGTAGPAGNRRRAGQGVPDSPVARTWRAWRRSSPVARLAAATRRG